MKLQVSTQCRTWLKLYMDKCIGIRASWIVIILLSHPCVYMWKHTGDLNYRSLSCVCNCILVT
jgi:hypothetical protein